LDASEISLMQIDRPHVLYNFDHDKKGNKKGKARARGSKLVDDRCLALQKAAIERMNKRLAQQNAEAERGEIVPFRKYINSDEKVSIKI